jgi:predicted Fe-S protein YdhL (DUF1289 family)
VRSHCWHCQRAPWAPSACEPVCALDRKGLCRGVRRYNPILSNAWGTLWRAPDKASIVAFQSNKTDHSGLCSRT